MKVTKFALIILVLMMVFPLSIIAQNNFQDSFNHSKIATRTDIRIDFKDRLGNQSFLPITIIKGKKQGPIFTVLAGVHGFEYPPIIAVQDLIQEINPALLTGTLIVVPIANTSSFFARTPFINPQDNINLNRTFPGNNDGSITEKIAYFITHNIIPVSDVFLDIHGGDANEDLTSFVCYYDNKHKPLQSQKAKELAERSGFKYVVAYPYTLKDDQPAKYAFKQAVQDGKTALSIESGKLGNLQEEAVDLIKMGVYNMLNEMKMYQTATEIKEEIVKINQQDYLKAKEKGIFYSAYEAGDWVEKGTKIGYTTDVFGKIISEFKAAHSGVILYKIGTPPVNANETVICIGYRL